MTVRLSHKYHCGQLVEINSHSLFSKWFSESGKLVQLMFEAITDLVEDSKTFVCVLIDEVESLASARGANSNEPSDAVRVVNAMLTQIDTIKKYPNVLILTTSNITGNIDLAFVDRADVKKYIGMPMAGAIEQMLTGSIQDLMSKDVITKSPLQNGHANGDNPLNLMEISQECVGFSGRTIRKLPVLAVAKMIESRVEEWNLQNFLIALKEAVQDQKSDRKCLQ